MVKHIQVGLLSADQPGRDFLASSWGKKSSSSDISLYSISSNELIQTTIVPESYPKKALNLVVTSHMSDLLVLSISSAGINAQVGEAAILADCLQIPGIKAVVGNDVKGLESYLDQMDKVFRKLSIKEWSGLVIHDGKASADAREILKEMYTGPRNNSKQYLAINVDHAFPVQGVGSVILGTIISGSVEKGQQVSVYPSAQSGNVRSIQVNDEDVKSAGPGTHVGLALKGILPKYLQRGTVISSKTDEDVEEVEQLEFDIRPAAFGKIPEEGGRIHVLSGLFDVPATVESWENNHVIVKLDKSTPVFPDNRITLMDLNVTPVILGSKL